MVSKTLADYNQDEVIGQSYVMSDSDSESRRKAVRAQNKTSATNYIDQRQLDPMRTITVPISPMNNDLPSSHPAMIKSLHQTY